MGILDSNKVKVTPDINSIIYWQDQVEITNNDYRNKIDCKSFSTLQLEVFSRSANSKIEFKGLLINNAQTYGEADDIIWHVETDKTRKVQGGEIIAGGKRKTYMIDVSRYDTFYINKINEEGSLTLSYKLTNNPIPIHGRYNSGYLEKLSENTLCEVWRWNVSDLNLAGVKGNVWVWNNATNIFISQNGIEGERTRVPITDMPNLISGSTISQVIIMPWTRNAFVGTTSHTGSGWRINVITNRGQIYHNFPSRSTTSDGTEQADDWKLFDESVVWDSEHRKHPVKTSGDPNIATGKYEYLPALPNDNYTLYPAINDDNGYGNGGFGTTTTKSVSGGTKTFGRFYFPNRNNEQGNPFYYMSGYEPHPKITLFGTYRSNTNGGLSTRICVFATNDGGREWFNIYEYGANTRIVDSMGVQLGKPITNFSNKLMFEGATTIGQFKVRGLSNIIPDEASKEPVNKYELSPEKDCVITGTNNEIIVSCEGHGFLNGMCVFFETGTGANDWSWIANDSVGANSSGNGRFFKAEVIDNNSFRLFDEPHDVNNNLSVRHVHSINRSKDGYLVGTGEGYPYGGWIHWIPVPQSDKMLRKYPWDDFEFIRLNSTAESIQRPLGVVLHQDDTVFVGVDNDLTPVKAPIMPEGRTDTFTRSSTGVWKGKLSNFDKQADFNCVLESDEVCYYFKRHMGYYIHIGQIGHFGISKDGENWYECKIANRAPQLENFGGISNANEIAINNIVIVLK